MLVKQGISCVCTCKGELVAEKIIVKRANWQMFFLWDRYFFSKLVVLFYCNRSMNLFSFFVAIIDFVIGIHILAWWMNVGVFHFFLLFFGVTLWVIVRVARAGSIWEAFTKGSGIISIEPEFLSNISNFEILFLCLDVRGLGARRRWQERRRKWGRRWRKWRWWGRI